MSAIIRKINSHPSSTEITERDLVSKIRELAEITYVMREETQWRRKENKCISDEEYRQYDDAYQKERDVIISASEQQLPDLAGLLLRAKKQFYAALDLEASNEDL